MTIAEEAYDLARELVGATPGVYRQDGQFLEGEAGINKLEYFAALCMQGVIANPHVRSHREAAQQAVEYAKALCAALAEAEP